MWWLLQHDLPRTTSHVGWYFHHGGDQNLYFQVAQDILAGQPRPQTASTGWSFVLAGLLKFIGGDEYTDILPLVVIGCGVWLGLLSVAVMARLALQLTDSRGQALAVAAVWTLLPYLLWFGFAAHPQAEVLRNAYVPRQMWMTGITDGSSLLFAAWGALCVFQKHSTRRRAMIGCFLGGLSLGWAMALRIQVLPIVAVALIAMGWSRQWLGVGVMAVGVITGFAPQGWYAAASTGHPLNLPYFVEWLWFDRDGRMTLLLNNLPANPTSLFENLFAWARRLPALVIVAVAGAGAAAGAFVSRWRQNSAAAIFMYGAPLGSFMLHVITYIYKIDPLRYTLPAVSIGLPAAAWTASWMTAKIYRRWSRR